MHRDRIAALYDVHSWAGLVFAVLIFIVCASGAVAVFSVELDHWSNPALRTRADAPVRVNLDAALAKFRAANLLRDGAFIGLPRELQNHYDAAANNPDERQARTYVDAETGELHTGRQNYLFWYLRHLHVRLMSPQYGRLFVGIIGMAMLLSIGTGVLIHKHIFRDLFRMRWKRGDNGRALLSELHKWVGVWALAFHIVIATTGAWLGLESYISKVIRAGLDQPEETRRADAGSATDADLPHVQMIEIAPLLERAPRDLPGLVPTHVNLKSWSTASGQVTVAGNLPGTLLQEGSSRVTYSGVDGSTVAILDMRQQGAWAQVRAALEPLHYGYFGGLWLKALYLLMGLSPALLSMTGALIWFDRRARLRGEKADQKRQSRERADLETV
jgi:uncharacterized iron-regulated membrane protein